ncbi:hypothetical protein Hanom_Chr00s058235g01783971 [Helianthus anomalus]
MLKTYGIYIIFLRLGYKKPTAFALCASFLDLITFVRLSLFKAKNGKWVKRVRHVQSVFIMFNY